MGNHRITYCQNANRFLYGKRQEINQLNKHIMSERKRIYLCLAHMSEAGLEQKYIKEAFDTNWVVPLGPNVNGF